MAEQRPNSSQNGNNESSSEKKVGSADKVSYSRNDKTTPTGNTDDDRLNEYKSPKKNATYSPNRSSYTSRTGNTGTGTVNNNYTSQTRNTSASNGTNYTSQTRNAGSANKTGYSSQTGKTGNLNRNNSASGAGNAYPGRRNTAANATDNVNSTGGSSRVRGAAKGNKRYDDVGKSGKNNLTVTDEEIAKAERRRAAKKKMRQNNAKRIGIILGIVIVISIGISVVTISCFNDVLAIHISESSDQTVSVEITDGMTTSEVIEALDDAGAIKNAWFCKIAAKIIGYNDEGYIARTYEFNRSMGLENMLNEIKDIDSDSATTISLTFPEGYTADQIIDMLEENNVCTREKLLSAIESTDFADTYDFLESVTNESERYNILEGYLFPDTYDFYIGETADSVIKKFLTNFEDKWTDNYTSLADEMDLTVDQVVILASIVEKEAVGDDMYTVASILLNRLDAGMQLECDSTSNYMSLATGDLTESEKIYYNQLYSTYICSSYPAGAICNPGVSAIEAVLDAPDTSYYYFIHDSNNDLRPASSLSEQEANIATYGLAE